MKALPTKNPAAAALVVLAMFFLGTVSAAMGEAPRPTDSDGQMGHPGGSSCPDPDGDGGPCGPTCHCTCCPGHWTGATFSVVRPLLDTPPCDEIEVSLPDDLHPQDAIYRIFHPPRA